MDRGDTVGQLPDGLEVRQEHRGIGLLASPVRDQRDARVADPAVGRQERAAERELEDCVVFTDGGRDLEEKIASYLERPDERERIARNGYEYAIRFATIESRMETLLDYMKGIA